MSVNLKNVASSEEILLSGHLSVTFNLTIVVYSRTFVVSILLYLVFRYR